MKWNSTRLPPLPRAPYPPATASAPRANAPSRWGPPRERVSEDQAQTRPSLPLVECIVGAVGGPPTRDGSCDKHAHARTHAHAPLHAHASARSHGHPRPRRACAAVSGDVAAGESTGRRSHPSEAAAEGALCAQWRTSCVRLRARACMHACSCVREAWVYMCACVCAHFCVWTESHARTQAPTPHVPIYAIDAYRMLSLRTTAVCRQAHRVFLMLRNKRGCHFTLETYERPS